MKAVNQYIGRAVRPIVDYACVYLVHMRYTNQNIQRKLPQWNACHIQVTTSYGQVQARTFFETLVSNSFGWFHVCAAMIFMDKSVDFRATLSAFIYVSGVFFIAANKRVLVTNFCHPLWHKQKPLSQSRETILQHYAVLMCRLLDGIKHFPTLREKKEDALKLYVVIRKANLLGPSA
ncbi:hypothetical protein GQX74_014254 [Glossina fuscipes]|nr:hypothetical protein GQX74_014254 [Glossina fuscipes]